MKVFEPGWIEPLLRFHKRGLKNKNRLSSTTCGEDLQNICKELSKVLQKFHFPKKVPKNNDTESFCAFGLFDLQIDIEVYI